MGILDIFFKQKKQDQKLDRKDAPRIMINKLGAYNKMSNKKYSSYADEGYNQNAIVHRSVDIISINASSVKLDVFDDDIKLDNHELITLLDRPNPLQSGQEFFTSLFSYLMISGNTYILRDADDLRPPRELYLLRPDRIQIKAGETIIPSSYDYVVDGKTLKSYPVDQTTGQSQLKQIKLFNPVDDYYGCSPMMSSAYNIDQHNLAGIHNVALLKNGATPSGMLKFNPRDEAGESTTLTDDQRARLLEDLEFRFQGSHNSGRPLLLEGDFDYTQMGLSPKDMDFLELSNMSAREIALSFGVPAQLIGIPDAQTYSNMETAKLSLYEETIIPLLQRVESDLNEFLAPLYDGNIRVQYDIDSIPAMAEKRRQIYENVVGGVQAGILTRNEARERLGLESVSGGDELYIPSNLFPIGETQESSEDNAKPVDVDGAEKDFNEMYGEKARVDVDTYTTEEEAERRADEIGCAGTHSHSIDGQTVYMPCRTHGEYEARLSGRYQEEDKQTNFPQSGDDKKISLRNSNFPLFDREFAKTIKEEHPDIWRAGGNIEGNRSYRLLTDHLDNDKETPTILDKIKEREAWASRHFEDGSQFKNPDTSPTLSNIAGVVAQMKWLVIGTLGERTMKDVVMDVIKKREDKRYHDDEDEDETKAPRLTAKAKKGIENKVKDHNEKHGNKKGKRVTVRMLSAVYVRGIGAYRTNPQSVRSNVQSEEQWAMARVNAFLRAVVTGRFSGGKFDLDLLPRDHPLSSKK